MGDIGNQLNSSRSELTLDPPTAILILSPLNILYLGDDKSTFYLFCHEVAFYVVKATTIPFLHYICVPRP